MHGMCDKKILQSCSDELEKASYNGLGLNLILLSVPDFWSKMLLVSLSTFTFSIVGILGLVICKELLSVWQDDSEHLPSVNGERQIHSLHSV